MCNGAYTCKINGDSLREDDRENGKVSTARPTLTNRQTRARRKELGHHPRSVKTEINGVLPGDPLEQSVYPCLYERGIKSVITTWRGFSWRGTCYRHMRRDKQTRKRGFFRRRLRRRRRQWRRRFPRVFSTGSFGLPPPTDKQTDLTPRSGARWENKPVCGGAASRDEDLVSFSRLDTMPAVPGMLVCVRARARARSCTCELTPGVEGTAPFSGASPPPRGLRSARYTPDY